MSGDARLEIGDLTGAHERYDQLNRLAPSGPVWSRFARLAFLEGNASLAIALVQRAIEDAEANGFGDETAFYRYQLGELLRATGYLEDAAASYESALDSFPDYPAAIVGLALTREGQGRRSEAIALLEAASTRLPTPDSVAALGDLYLLAGETEAAERQYALVERMGQWVRPRDRSMTANWSCSRPTMAETLEPRSRWRGPSSRCVPTSMASTRWPGPCSRPVAWTRRRRPPTRPLPSALRIRAWRTTPG